MIKSCPVPSNKWIKIIPKTIGHRKKIVCEVAGGDRPYLRKLERGRSEANEEEKLEEAAANDENTVSTVRTTDTNAHFYDGKSGAGVKLRPCLHEDDLKTIGTKSYLSGKKSFRIGLLFTRRRSVSASFWRRYEDDRKSGNFWRRYGNDSITVFLFHGCTQHPSLAQSASSIQSRGGRQVACRPVILPFTYSPKGQ